MPFLIDLIADHPYFLAMQVGLVGGLLATAPGLSVSRAHFRVAAVFALAVSVVGVGILWQLFDPDGHPYGGSAWSWGGYNAPMHVRVVSATGSALALAMARALADLPEQDARTRMGIAVAWWVCLPLCFFAQLPVSWFSSILDLPAQGVTRLWLLALCYLPLLAAHTAASRSRPWLALGAPVPILALGAIPLMYTRAFPYADYDETDWRLALYFALAGVWLGGILGDLARAVLGLGRDGSVLLTRESVEQLDEADWSS